jgi:hypothetical protein
MMTLKQLAAEHGFINYHETGDQLKNYIYGLSRQAYQKGLEERLHLSSLAELRDYNKKKRAAFIEGIGGLPPSNTSLNAQCMGVIESSHFVVEKIIFESRPQVYVTANMYLPKKRELKNPAILFLCGHHEGAKHQPEYQHVIQTLVHKGFIVMAQDPCGQGERFQYVNPENGKQLIGWGTTDHDYAGFQCLPLGLCIARYFLHDAIRGLDYLLGRDEVDTQRIGVTGNSGGGTQTSLLMLVEDRIQAAAPGTFIMNRESYQWTGAAQDCEQIWRGFSSLGMDHVNILIMMAPKPVCVLAAAYDFFPIEGTRQTVTEAKRFWEMENQGDRLQLVIEKHIHHYSPALANHAAAFFATHFFNDPNHSVTKDTPTLFNPEDLWCTSTGQVATTYKNETRFVFDELQTHLSEPLFFSSDKDSQLSNARIWLQEKVQMNRSACDLFPRFLEEYAAAGLLSQRIYYFSQSNIINHGFYLQAADRPRSNHLVLAIWQNGTAALQDHATILLDWTHNRGWDVLVLDISGEGGLRANQLAAAPYRSAYGTLYKLTDDLFWLNDSLVALRVYEILRFVDLIAYFEHTLSKITLATPGAFALYGALAAFLEPRFENLYVDTPIETLFDWVKQRYYDAEDRLSFIMPEVLRYLDGTLLASALEERIHMIHSI